MTLTEFLLARIAEDEAVAWDALAPEGWDGNPGRGPGFDVGLDELEERALFAHPARVLAGLGAKRRIVELAGGVAPGDDDIGAGARWALTQTLRLLALPYAEHPDYDEAWRV